MSLSSTEMKTPTTPPASPVSRRSNSPLVNASWYEKLDVKMHKEEEYYDYLYQLVSDSHIFPVLRSSHWEKIDTIHHTSTNKLAELTKLLTEFLKPLVCASYHSNSATLLGGVNETKEIRYLTALLYHPILFQYFDFSNPDMLVAIRKVTLNAHLIEAVTPQPDEKAKDLNFKWAKSILNSAGRDTDIINKNSPIQFVSLNDTQTIHLLFDHGALITTSFLETMDKNHQARTNFFMSIIKRDNTLCLWHDSTIASIAQHSNWKEQLFELLVKTVKESTQPVSILDAALNKLTALYKIFATHRGLGMFASFGITAGGKLAKIEALRDQYKQHKQTCPLSLTLSPT